ncbi:MAG: hypothetical protein IT480_18825 [Gammaproteobacteria bacterium]|nr:hypothetical protein [Gammaproteobacteria bacterium]
MDPILEEMQRAKDVQYGRFRSWTTYLCALVAAKDDEIATLKAQLTDALGGPAVTADEYVKRGPGRPRKTEAVNG